MNEQFKLDEAKYFLTRLSSLVADHKAFCFELSALLSSARSVLQYALDEAKKAKGGQAWFDGHASQPYVRFFKDKRDASIHQEPVIPYSQVSVEVTETIHFSETITIEILHADGTISPPASFTTPASPETEVPPVVTYQYRFNDWPGPEDVLALCPVYIATVEAIVADGRAKGFLNS